MIHVIKQTLMITSFVMVMMLIIEYINVQTKGNWTKPLHKSGFLQIVVSTLLGVIPGCLGAYAVVSLYTHHIVNFGALVAALIATFGDEAFIMFSVMPLEAAKLTALLIVIAILSGLIINFFRKRGSPHKKDYRFDIHEEHIHCYCFDKKNIIKQIRHMTFPRAILIFGILVFLFLLLIGQFSHDHHGDNNHNWIHITFTIAALIALFIVTTVPEHFLEEHLWGHIIKKHFIKIFLWILCTLTAIHFLLEYVELEEWVRTNSHIILFAAVLIGIIPISGPHIIFITLFMNGIVPFSILFANSIVQDGHGALPLLAESRNSFILVKFIKIILALLIGASGLYFGW